MADLTSDIAQGYVSSKALYSALLVFINKCNISLGIAVTTMVASMNLHYNNIIL